MVSYFYALISIKIFTSFIFLVIVDVFYIITFLQKFVNYPKFQKIKNFKLISLSFISIYWKFLEGKTVATLKMQMYRDFNDAQAYSGNFLCSVKKLLKNAFTNLP